MAVTTRVNSQLDTRDLNNDDFNVLATAINGIEAGTTTLTEATISGTLGVTGVAAFTATPTTAAGITDDGGVLFVGYEAAAVQQALSGAGAVNLTTYYTAVTNTGSDALTLADGIKGQVKKVKMIVDPGTDSTLTFNTNATIVFADVGDYAVLLFDGSDWIPIELGNDADGATAPVYTPAS